MIFSLAEPRLAVYSHLALRGINDQELQSRTRKHYDGPLVVGRDQFNPSRTPRNNH